MTLSRCNTGRTTIYTSSHLLACESEPMVSGAVLWGQGRGPRPHSDAWLSTCSPTRCVCQISVNYKCPALTNDIHNLVLKPTMLHWRHEKYLYVCEVPPSKCEASIALNNGNARTAGNENVRWCILFHAKF